MKCNLFQRFLQAEHDLCQKASNTEEVGHTRHYHDGHHDPKDDGYL